MKLFKLVKIYANLLSILKLFKLVRIGLKLYKLVYNCQCGSKHVQTCPNLPDIIQNCSKFSKLLVESCIKVSKIVQTYLKSLKLFNWSKLGQIGLN